jgi:hypothetical protein
MNSMMNLARFGLMASAFVATCAMVQAQEPHPRIWLSPAVKARLQDARTANTPEWAALKSWCDARLGTDLPELYNYLEWYTTTMNFALAYQISGDPAYGNEGVKYLTALLRDRDTIGDGLGGTNAVHMDSGYVSRSLGTGVSIGRDWLDGAPNLTPAIIAECTARMDEWYTWIQRPETYGIGEPQTNYHAGHFTMTYTASIAFEGDPGYQMAWQTKAEEMWADVRDLLNTEGQGGDFGEGWNYGPWAVREYLGYPWALETGTTRPDHWDEIDFASQLARAHVSMLHPSREYFSDDGRWSGDNKGDPRSTVCRMVSVLPDTDATGKGLAVWFAQNLEWQPGGPDRWEAFLYTDHSIAPITPSPATVGGLTWKGYGHAVARGADWSNQEATFVDVIAWKHLSEEHNFGEIKIASRQELLLTDGQTWQLEAEFANVPRINGTHTYAPYQEVWHEASSLDVDSVDGVYTYFKMDNMENAYDGVNDDDPSCSYFRRDAVFVAPDHVVVFDNIVSTTLANTVAEQWHVMGNPVLAGDTATVTGTNAKMFLRTMTPAVTLSETDTDATREGTFRVDAVPVTPVIANHVVTLFEAADATQPSMTPAEVLSPAGLTGIHVQDASDPAIVLFATAPDAALTSVDFSFVPTSSSTRVVIIGVAPSTGFDVAITDGTGGAKDVSLTPGSTFTSAANGSITFTTAAPPSAVSTWTEYD